MKILVAGASGFIGTELGRQLEADGHTVLRLVRRTPTGPGEYLWSPTDLTVDPEAIEAADAVINLAGATTGRIPWTAAYKREILYSRVLGTRTLAEAIGRTSDAPAVFLNGSAVGYYGDRPGETLTEESSKGTGFLSDVVQAWEQAARLTPEGTRLVMFRTGLAVGKGGAFTPIIPLTKLGLATRFGTGRQNWPWISVYDEAAAIRHLLGSQLDGVVNLAGPVPATAGEITDGLAEAMHRWHLLIAPTFALDVLGDAGRDLLLASQVSSPTRLLSDGFTFRHRTATEALSELAREL